MLGFLGFGMAITIALRLMAGMLLLVDTDRLNVNDERSRSSTSQSSFLVEEGSSHSSFLVELGTSKSAILAARLRSNIFTRSHGITDTNTTITIQH